MIKGKVQEIICWEVGELALWPVVEVFGQQLSMVYRKFVENKFHHQEALLLLLVVLLIRK